MVRKQWLWLFIWIFIFFSIFCIWSKLDDYKKTAPQKEDFVENNQTRTKLSQPKPKTINKNMALTLIKKGDLITISGNVPNKQTKDEIIDRYKELFADVNMSGVVIDKETNEDLFGIDLLSSLAEDFSHFKEGVIEYDTNHLEINGSSDETIAKASIDKKIQLLQEKGVDANENIVILKSNEEALAKQTSNDDLNGTLLQSSKDQNVSNSDTNSTTSSLDQNSSSNEQNEQKLSLQDRLNRVLSDKKIQFLFGKDLLTKESKKVLDSIAKILNENNETLIEIAGHTDSLGNSRRNLKLSQRRAQSVKRYLVIKGVKEERLKAVGYGESKPLVPNNTPKNRQINRRVEFKVIGEKR